MNTQIWFSNTLKKHKQIFKQCSKIQYLAPTQAGIFPSLLSASLVTTDEMIAALQGQSNRAEHFSQKGPTVITQAQ